MDEASAGSSIGDAVSGRGADVVGEDDVYYIPERRPSLDLGTNSLDLNYWYWYNPSLPSVSLGIPTKCSARKSIYFLEYQLLWYSKFLSQVTYTRAWTAVACLKPALFDATPSATLFFRVGESREVGAAQPLALSYGSLRSEQTSDRMGHSDEPGTRYIHIQKHKCIVLKGFQESRQYAVVLIEFQCSLWA